MPNYLNEDFILSWDNDLLYSEEDCNVNNPHVIKEVIEVPIYKNDPIAILNSKLESYLRDIQYAAENGYSLSADGTKHFTKL